MGKWQGARRACGMGGIVGATFEKHNLLHTHSHSKKAETVRLDKIAICYLQEVHFKYEDPDKLKVKRWKKIPCKHSA